jgi:hypothetical protein
VVRSRSTGPGISQGLGRQIMAGGTHRTALWEAISKASKTGPGKLSGRRIQRAERYRGSTLSGRKENGGRTATCETG